MRSGCGCSLSRRGFLAGAAGLAAASAAAAQEPPFRIDVHHHLYPPDYLRISNAKFPQPPMVTGWTPQRSLEQMDAAGIRTAMLSITTPGLYFGDPAQATELARNCNEYSARLAADHPGRFGSFAALPVPDVDAALLEIGYALDTLHADGICMFTSYDRTILGDPQHAPIFEELNRRRAVLYTHPADPSCCVNIVPGVADHAIEFGTDTTRAIANLVFGGFAQRYPDIKVIWSHAGGTMPFLIERFQLQAGLPPYRARLPDGPTPLLRAFHYDTAQASNPVALGALTQLVPMSQIMFGTDYPYRTCTEHVTNLATCGFTPAQLRAIERDNAAALLPGVA